MKRNWLAVGIILLFIGISVIPAIAQNDEIMAPTSRGNWLYVGGDGPGNYTKIQDAIDNSSLGDTVYVYNGIYYETVTVNVMSLTLIGENKDKTLIDARHILSTGLSIKQSFVVIQGFSILADDNWIFGNGIYVYNGFEGIKIRDNNLSITPRGINVDGQNNYDVIENNIFYSNFYGILLANSGDKQCTIQNNIFVGNTDGLVLGGIDNEIINNTFRGCGLTGIDQSSGSSSTFMDNIFIDNDVGLSAGGSNKFIENIFIENGIGLSARGPNTILGNHFENNGVGLQLELVSNSVITGNNFINNSKDATFSEGSRSHGNRWDGNYWGVLSYLFGIKLISGWLETKIPKIIQFYPATIRYYWIPWINFDKDPVRKPFDIGRNNE